MSDTVKINLNKIAVILVIVFTLASAVGGGYIAYDNAKVAKAQSGANAKDISELKARQARFEGVMDERTRNTQLDVKRIYDIVKEWEP